MIPVCIYSLDDPRTGLPAYVGRTWQPLPLRLWQHIDRSKGTKDRTAKAEWIRLLLADGLRPTIHLLEEVAFDDWQEAEGFWMAYLRFCGAALANEAPAGAGGTRSHVVEWTPELDAMLGKVADSAVAELIGVTRKAVAYRRRKLRIEASHDRSRSKPPPNNAGWNRVELPADVIGRLGTMPDHALAAVAGVSKKRIIKERRSRHIDSHASRTGQDGRYRDGNYPQRWLNRRK